MTRYPGWQDEAAVARITGRKHARQPRPQPLCGLHRPAFSRVEQTATGYLFTWVGWLPRISGHQLNRYARSRLCKLARQVFGELPPCLHAQRHARVEVIRVLGPRQKPLDRDSLSQLAVGLIDGIKRCGYLKDDSEVWADVTYTNDRSRRDKGPSIQIVVVYQEPSS